MSEQQNTTTTETQGSEATTTTGASTTTTTETQVKTPEELAAEAKAKAEQEEKDRPFVELRKHARELDKSVRRLSRENAELRQVVATTMPKDPAPTRDKFNTDEEFIDARFAFNQRQIQRTAPQVGRFVADKIAEATREHADFAEKMRDIDHLQFPTERLDNALSAMQYGSEVLYHLATNPDEAEEIAALPPDAIVARLGEIHADIRRERKTLKPVSKAPAPITPVKEGGSPARDYDNMSQEEFARVRREERKKHKMGLAA